MNKPFVNVLVVLHGDVEFNIYDYVDENGKYIAVGTEAAAMLDRHEDIHYMNLDEEPKTEYILPYHAIIRSKVSKEPAKYEKPEDSYCQPVDSPFVKSRTVSLPKYGDPTDPLTNPYDEALVFDYMIPYMLSQNIGVKFLGEKVTAINQRVVSSATIYDVTTDKGTHEIRIPSGYKYPVIDGVTADKVSVTVSTDKYYFVSMEMENKVDEGLYDNGSQPVCSSEYISYKERAFTQGLEYQFGEDHKFPAITADVMYSVMR